MHEQTWDPDRYARNARFVADLGAPLIDLLAPQPGERILDLGCGDGALTERLAACGCTVVGVDGSAEQITAAKTRGLDAHVMNGEALTFSHEFDAVFSNAALHWMKRADAVIEGVRRALKPGGRFVAEMGGAGCVAKVRGAVKAALARRGQKLRGALVAQIVVEQHNVEMAIRKKRERFANAGAVFHVEPRLASQGLSHTLAKQSVIVHQQSANHRMFSMH